MAEENKKKAELSPEQKLKRKASRELGYIIWRDQYRKANPEATKEDGKSAWKEVSKDYVTLGRRALKSLKKRGYDVHRITADAKQAAE